MSWQTAKLMPDIQIDINMDISQEEIDQFIKAITGKDPELPPVPDKKTLIQDAGETLETMKEVRDAHVQD